MLACCGVKTNYYLDHRKHPPTVLSDDHLVGETLELVPQLGVLQVDVRSVGGVCVGDILLETVEKMLWDFHCNFHYHESVRSLFFLALVEGNF